MSFYYDDNAEDTNQISNEICPNCLGNDFYDDPVTGQLTCSSCFAQSQTATQEELDLNDGMDLAAQFGNRKMSRAQGDGSHKGRVARPLTEYDRSKKLPDAESCCLAFQWLLWDASKCVSKLAGIQEEELELEDHNSRNQQNDGVLLFDNEEDEEDEDTNDNRQLPTIMERTVKDIWFKYLNVWSEAMQEYSTQYPEMRVSFRDYFLPAIQKAHLLRHLSVTIGKRVENEVLEDMQKSIQKGKPLPSEEGSMASSNESDIDKDGDNTSDSKPSGDWKSKGKMYKGRPFLSIAQMVKWVMPAKPKRYPDGTYQLHPHQAVLKMQPSLTLLLAILQLACNHLRTGIAPHHLTMWVSSGQLPHALNGYAMLPSDMKEGVEMVKNFFGNSYVPPPSVIADLTGMLATACSWYGDRKDTSRTKINEESPEEACIDESVLDIDISRSSTKTEVVANEPCIQTSPYNIPLLAARMVQDFGFDQTVFNNTMALMGIPNDDSKSSVAKQGEEEGSDESKNATEDQIRSQTNATNKLPPQLDCASPEKLYTPLHIAALIVIACKLCPGWESWRITNLHANTKINNNSNVDNGDSSEPKHVPWNEAQLQLIGNGPTLNHYLNFLEETAFGEVTPSTKMTQFFQTLEKDMKQAHMPNDQKGKNGEKIALPKNSANVTPNLILSGAHNPNIPTDSSSPLYAQYQTANNIGKYTSYQYRMQGNKKILGHEPYHPHYCRLLEYICYIIEEPKTAMLHNMVEEYEKELLLPHRTKRNRKKKRKVRESNLAVQTNEPI